jgi:outer membrane protein TolC
MSLPRFNEVSIHEVLQASPEIRNVDIELEILKNKEILSGHMNKPKLDVTLEASEDQGRGSHSLAGNEQKLIFNIEIPIERNLGDGQGQEARSKRRILEAKRKFFAQKVEAKLNSVLFKLSTHKKIIKNLTLELELSEKLLEAEEIKFKKGDSNLLLVNIREQKIINTKVRKIKLLSSFMSLYASYRALKAGILL